MKHKNSELLPYYKEAKKGLNYNPDTGIFTRWIESKQCYKTEGHAHRGYLSISITIDNNQKNLLAHRIAWFITYNKLPNIVDHINHKKSDNRINNLRECTKQQNGFNRGKQLNNTSGYKGVTWNKVSGKYLAKIWLSGKTINLGMFACPKEASEVYESKAKELFGEFYCDDCNE